MALSFIIEEVTGPKRSIELRGRSGPYTEVVFGGSQRVNINYFPGNPVATAQVVGPVYKPTKIKGTWKDWFLSVESGNGAPAFISYDATKTESAPILKNFPTINKFEPGTVGGTSFSASGAVEGNNEKATRAVVIRDAIEMLRRSGQLLRVEWGSIVRYGYLTEADFTYGRFPETDISWEVQFDWVGDSINKPKVTKRDKLDPLSQAQLIESMWRDLLDAVARAQHHIDFIMRRYRGRISALTSLVTETIGAMRGSVNTALIPLESLGHIRQNLVAVMLESKGLADDARNVQFQYVSAAHGRSQATGNLAAMFSFDIIRAASRLAVEAARQKRQLDGLNDDRIIGIYISPGGVTLRDVSRRYYGTPTGWRAIQEWNGLQISILPQGMPVQIPKR